MKGTITIVALGDSITVARRQEPENRWLNIVERELVARHPGTEFRVFNAGVGSECDREKMARFQSDVVDRRPDVVLLQFGGNNTGFANPQKRVKPNETEAYLEHIRAELPAETAIVAITFPRIVDERHSTTKLAGAQKFLAPWGGLDGSAERFRTVVRDFARRHGCPLADLSESMRRAPDSDKFTLPDGVHLTADGNRLLADLVLGCLADIVEKMA